VSQPVYEWYEVLDNTEPLTQGDIILECPVIETTDLDEDPYIQADLVDICGAIVMTQACDLEHGKVDNITLCPIQPFCEVLKDAMSKRGVEYSPQNGKQRAEKQKVIDMFLNGQYTNYHVLDKFDSTEFSFGYHVVKIKETYSMPRKYIELVLKERGGCRIRLLPPYREHLSQAFARIFMRIGLPIDLTIEQSEV